MDIFNSTFQNFLPTNKAFRKDDTFLFSRFRKLCYNNTHWVALNSGTSVQVAVISFLAICTFYSLYWVLFCLIIHLFEKIKFSSKIQLLLIPFTWVLIENLRDLGPLAAPWLNLSLSQTGYNLSLIHI